MTESTAWIFPGQGSQYPSMGRSLWSQAAASQVLDLAESISGLSLGAVMANGPAVTLRRPEYLEPAIVCLQIACVQALRSRGLSPHSVAGYSLGEIGALYCAGCLSIEAALRLASERGKILMRQAEAAAWCSLAASLPAASLTGPILTPENVFTASYNSPRDFTFTGEESHVRVFERELLKRGVSLSPVLIDGPWHSPLAAQASRETLALLKTIEFSKPRLPVCLASSACFEENPALLKTSLAAGIAAPVLWSGTLETLWQAGVRSTIEMAPGRVLTGFIRNNWRGREYSAHFLEREGGRAIDFEIIRKSEESGWKRSA